MNIALILSGGAGLRLGAEIPKQYIEAGGRPVIGYCIECLALHRGVDAIQIVAQPCWREKIRECLETFDRDGKFRGFSDPGENRQLSILQGLEDIRAYGGEEDCVLIHDAARPLLTEEMVSACLEAAQSHEGVLPVLPMKDTVYASSDGKTITSLLKRSEIFAGQAPEVFRLGRYYEANLRLLPDGIRGIHGSTEPAVLAGMDIAIIPGDEGNFKITTMEDLRRFEEILARRCSGE